MKRVSVFGLVGLVATVVVGAERDVLDNWENVVSTNDFRKTLADVKSFQEDWPAVHSIKHKENKNAEKALVQTGYRDVARTFLQGLEEYEKTLQAMSPEAFCEAADALLNAREKFLKHPSYINYFLADCINRVIYVNLGKRLAKVGDVPICYDKIVKCLAEFKRDWSLFYELVSGEYDTKPISKTEFEKLNINDKTEIIEKIVGQENFIWGGSDLHNLFGLRILEKCSLSPLMARLIVSDNVIGAFLPACLSYRRKAANFAPTDSLEQIYAVLGDEVYLPPTLLHSNPLRTAGIADDFLRQVQSENWRLILAFSDPPWFTKEYIEHKERE